MMANQPFPREERPPSSLARTVVLLTASVLAWGSVACTEGSSSKSRSSGEEDPPAAEFPAVSTSDDVPLTVPGPLRSGQHVEARYVVAGPAPTADFDATPRSGPAPLPVQFSDASAGVITAWHWDFGDGTSSSLQHPQVQYASAGTYTVSLTVTGPGRSDTLVEPGFITVTPPPPTAAFAGAPRSGDAILPVQFTDASSGEFTEWLWDFGDGSTSPEQHPLHDYDAAGEYPVSLTVTGPGGSDQLVEPQYVSVSVPGAGGGELSPTIWRSNAADITYCPPERLAYGPAIPEQHLNVFLPGGTKPTRGWPVLIATNAGGQYLSPPLAALNETDPESARFHAFVEAGIAVVHYGEGSSGLFYPPGDPSGRYESFDPAHDTFEKDAEWVVQWVKSNAGSILDLDRIAIYGSSQGSIMALWACMGPDRAKGTGSAQVRASTRVAGIVARQPMTSVWAFRQDIPLGLASHFEVIGYPGLPAAWLVQVLESHQKGASAARFCFESPAVIAANATQPVCLIYADPVVRDGDQPADMTLDAQGFPNLHDRLGPPYNHDSWAGYVFFKMLLDISPESAAFHRARSVFAMRVEEALDPPHDYHTHTYSGPFNGAESDALIHDWVRATLYVH